MNAPIERHESDLGWANHWRETPLVVVECRAAGHRPVDVGPPSKHEVSCELCGYRYFKDTSD